MSDETYAHDVAPSVYINLVAAHGMLVRMRDHVRMLSSVFESLDGSALDRAVRPETLVWCVSCLADDLGEVEETVRWTKEACRN